MILPTHIGLKVVHCFLVFTRVLVRSSKRQGRNPRGMASSPLATSSTRAREHPELAEVVFTLQPLVSLVHFGGVGGTELEGVHRSRREVEIVAMLMGLRCNLLEEAGNLVAALQVLEELEGECRRANLTEALASCQDRLAEIRQKIERSKAFS
jgi:hypothetical protein